MRSRFFALNLKVLLLSFVMAVGIWYVVVIGDQVDIQLEVSVEYKNIPSHLIITDGLVTSIEVRLRGPEALMRDIPSSSRVHVVDLSNLHKGRNVIPFIFLRNKTLRAFDVQNITPSRLIVTADTAQERNVNVRAQISSSIPTSNFKIENVKVSPSSVLLRGPSNTVQNINNIPIRVRMDPKAQPGTYTQTQLLDILQPLVTATPSSVSVTYTVLSERKGVELNEKIRIESTQPLNYKIDPENLQINVEVPESLINNTVYLAGIKLSVTPPLLEIGESTAVPLNVTLPEGITLIKTLPKVVTVKRLR